MSWRLSAVIGVIALVAPATLAAQEHGAARPEPVKVAPSVVPPIPTDKRQIQVTPTVPPAKVAAAVAEAIRAAEAAEARRVSRAASGATPTPRTTAPTAPIRRYEVRWPEERMVVQWPVATSDRLTLAWPETF